MKPHGKLIDISVSRVKSIDWYGHSVSTGIFKEPVQGRVRVKRLGIVGDEQGDLTLHGGIDKAVYAYPSEHYDYWKDSLPKRPVNWGMFGENLTTAGLDEGNVCIGDEFKVGTARLRVSQPRMPCFKLGIKFGDDGIIRRFYRSSKWGFYFAVVDEGSCERGDEIIYLKGDGHNVKVMDVVRLILPGDADDLQFARVLNSNLADDMKATVFERFRARSA